MQLKAGWRLTDGIGVRAVEGYDDAKGYTDLQRAPVWVVGAGEHTVTQRDGRRQSREAETDVLAWRETRSLEG